MFGKVWSACVQGIQAQMIEVEVDISRGLPQVNLVGLPDTAVRESVERVRAAIKNCGFRFPMERVTINLAPADLRKEGASFDLAIASGILQTTAQSTHVRDTLSPMLMIGELALDGSLRPVNGVLAMAHHARNCGFRSIVVPRSNAREALLIDGIQVIGLKHLRDFIQLDTLIINDINQLTEEDDRSYSTIRSQDHKMITHEYADVSGQLHAKRALTIAAAGMHNAILIGPPGTGKTMLMRRLPSILPDLADEEALEVSKIYSIAGQLSMGSTLIRNRPFRAPHHTISSGGLIGGGSIPKPGEVSLAHRGVLFLDEFPEFSRTVLEVLRQPLEDKEVTIGRARAVYTFPTNFMLMASMNPCPCGFFGTNVGENRCICTPLQVLRYRSRVSGPLLDRIDLHVDVPQLDYHELTRSIPSLSSADMKRSVNTARDIQQYRYRQDAIQCNGELAGGLLHRYCRLKPDGEQLLKQSFTVLKLSIRAHDRILKIARTIADLDGFPHIELAHLAEALQYRNLDRTPLPYP